MTLRLLSYNIQRGGTGREEALAAVIAACAPDIAVFQEATAPAVVRWLAERCGMPYYQATGAQSLAFMSRIAIEHWEFRKPRVSRHAFLELVPAGLPVRIYGVHLSAVFAAWTEHRRAFELRALLREIRRRQHGFHALVGDFNTVAPGELLDLAALPQKVRATIWLSGGRVRWKTIQLVIDAGYVDAFRALHPDDPGLTLPASAPQVRLDYLFVPQADLARVTSCQVDRSAPAQQASDHLPLLSCIEV